MPTCCAPGCVNSHESHPLLTFFRFPWKKEKKSRMWLANLSLKHKPASEAKICQEHFEEKYLVLDPKYSIAPHLYPRPSYKLTEDAVPTIFQHKSKPAIREREFSVRRKRKREDDEVWTCTCTFITFHLSMVPREFYFVTLVLYRNCSLTKEPQKGNYQSPKPDLDLLAFYDWSGDARLPHLHNYL